MSRNLWIVLLVMCAGIAVLIVLPKFKPSPAPPVSVTDPGTTAAAGQSGSSGRPAGQSGTDVAPQPPKVAPAGSSISANNTAAGAGQSATPSAGLKPGVGATALQTGVVIRPGGAQPPIVAMNEEPDTKPLPVLEKDYLSATNRDDRLDLMMDITDWPGPDTVRTLARLFQAERDPELKVDLLDSLLGIEGQVDEKLQMLMLGVEKGLPTEVRQSAIDGLIDLEDSRVIAVLNGLLNDPDEEIRESAQDALEMLQDQPTLKSK